MSIALKNPAHHRFALQSCLGNAREIADGGRGCAEPDGVSQRNLMSRWHLNAPWISGATPREPPRIRTPPHPRRHRLTASAGLHPARATEFNK
jgi:hypothetical protein